jgi:hypothetical protein
MTAEVVNLNKVRKARERAEREMQAQENRTRFGLSKFEKGRVNAEQRKLRTDLDGAKRDFVHSAGDDEGPGEAS